jgi:hypothetical protein
LQEWDVNGIDATSPGPFDILLANNLSATAAHLPTALAVIYDNLTEGGFLMLQELTGPLGGLVLNQPDCTDAQERRFSPCTDVAHWQRLLTDAGFIEVSVVKSAF